MESGRKQKRTKNTHRSPPFPFLAPSPTDTNRRRGMEAWAVTLLLNRAKIQDIPLFPLTECRMLRHSPTIPQSLNVEYSTKQRELLPCQLSKVRCHKSLSRNNLSASQKLSALSLYAVRRYVNLPFSTVKQRKSKVLQNDTLSK